MRDSCFGLNSARGIFLLKFIYLFRPARGQLAGGNEEKKFLPPGEGGEVKTCTRTRTYGTAKVAPLLPLMCAPP
jgi:hypothetical protein